MRIVCLNQFYAPAEGTAPFLADAAESLAEAGHAVTVVCGQWSYPDPVRIGPRREVRNGVTVIRVRSSGFGRRWPPGRLLDYATFLIAAAARLPRLPRQDVVVSMSSPPMIPVLGLLAARLWGARSVYWVMDVYPDVAFALGALRRGSLLARVLRRATSDTLRRSDLVIAIGETMAARLRAGGAENVAVAHEWIDGASVRPNPIQGHPVRRQRGWDDRVVFLYSGNMGLPHEFDTLLGAAELLRGRAEIVFAFIGHGARLQAVQREVTRRGLSNVQFLPFADRAALGDSLSAADVLLVTLRDGLAGLLLPVKAYASLAAGRPCLFVGPADCEVAHFLAEGRCGARIAPGDARGLVEAVVRYAEEQPSRYQDGERARRLFEERFDKPSGVARFRALIEGLDRVPPRAAARMG